MRSVYYPLADMITWAVRISGLIRNRWFLVSGNISVGMELASKERLNNRYNGECNLKCKPWICMQLKVYMFFCRIATIWSAGLPQHSLFRTLFNTYYSVPRRSVYYPLADMITWAVRISGLIRNRWFLVSGNISVGMELASKERLNNKYNRECNLKCKAWICMQLKVYVFLQNCYYLERWLATAFIIPNPF